MSKAQKDRFFELKALGNDMTDSQQEEFDKLSDIAVKAGLDLETLSPCDQSSMTESELRNVVKGSVEDEIFGLREELFDKFEGTASKSDLERIVKKYATEGLSSEELTAKIEGLLSEQKSQSLDAETLTKSFSAALENVRVPTQAEYPASQDQEHYIEVPFGNTKGNLTIAQKQLLNVIQQKNIDEGIPESLLRNARAKSARIGSKALSAGGTNAGTELTNVEVSTAIESRVFAASDVAALFQGSEITMPTNPFKIPMATSRPDFTYQSAENTNVSASDPVLNEITLDAKKFMGETGYSYELDDDAIIAILPMLQEQLSLAAADALETAILRSGEPTTGTALGASLTDSISKIALSANGDVVTTSAAGAGLTDISVDLPVARAKLAESGINPNDLVLIVSTEGYGQMMQDTNVLTVDKFGDRATIVQGQVASVFGIPVIVSARLGGSDGTSGTNTGNLVDNASGNEGKINVGTASDNDAQRSAYLVHRPSFKLGVKGGFTLETDRDISTQTNKVVASFRRAFAFTDDFSGSGKKAVMIIDS